MSKGVMAIVLVLAGCASTAWGQAASRDPHVGYLYPAGGQQGTTVEILAGGQLLRGASTVYISGEGVRASVVRYFPPFNNLSAEQRNTFVRRMTELLEKRWAKSDEEV